jgi:peroxiredoxin Q/BCP
MKFRSLFFATLAAVIWTVSPSSEAGEVPAVGSEAPAFRLQDQNGEWHDLADYRGTWLAVYFYPKDDTPGCTTEACNFRDNIYAFKAIGGLPASTSSRSRSWPTKPAPRPRLTACFATGN